MWWLIAGIILYLVLANSKTPSADDDICPDGVSYCPQGDQFGRLDGGIESNPRFLYALRKA